MGKEFNPVPNAPLSLRTHRGRPAVGLLSLSRIPDDPRVRRQGDAFRRAGWDVIGIGLAGARSPEPEWEQAAVQWHGPRQRGYAEIVARMASLLAVRFDERRAFDLFWSSTSPCREIYDLARAHRPDVWIANDWTTLPIAQRLAQERRVPFVYDTHELATDEHAERAAWRVFNRPMIVALERRCLRHAALVTCVSGGIADTLVGRYGLERRPLVVLNTPGYREVPFRPTGQTVEMLYHGLVTPGRGLAECIRSAALWRPEFRLTIRGPAEAGYDAALTEEIRRAGVEDRIRLSPPVPMTSLVEEAARYDVGLFALPAHSLHNRLALPNKIFEYTMAGLALCVSDLPEMAELVRARGLGVLIRDTSPESIAASVNSLSREAIDSHKVRALAAARELNWEREGEKLVRFCAEAVQASEPPA
jgi:glycosyltransferase involved in cell wall biosynthesis